MANRAKGALGAFMVAFTAAFFALGLTALPSQAHAAEGDLTADTELVCTMDAQGNLTLPKATLTNNGTQDMVLESATCPAGFDWEFDLVGTTIPAGSSVTGTWTAKNPLTSDQAAAVAAAGKYLAGKFTYTANATGPQAFAVYSQTDNSLNFYKRSSVPAVGDTFEGKTVTEVYTGFETDSYWYGDAPWFYSQSSNAKTVAVVDEGIQPVSTRYWFYGMSNCTSMELSKLDTSNVTSMNFMFSGCSSLADLDVSGFDTQNVTNMYGMFSDCESLISLDLTKFDTSKVTSMNSMFESCSSLASLNLSGLFNTSAVTNMEFMFYYMYELQEVKLGANFKFVGTGGELPTPLGDYITGADGSWYNSAGTAYAPVKVPSNVADTYYATSPENRPTAFAVYSATDGSLNFYKRAKSAIPTAGSTFNGKTATEVYTGIETDTPSWAEEVPWYSHSLNMKSVAVVNEGIQPVSTAYWFAYMENCTSIDVKKLDTSAVLDMSSMFDTCSSLTSLDLSSFDTANVRDMNYMFYGCDVLTSLDLSSFDTANVRDMRSMFSGCSGLTSLDVSSFNTQSVTTIQRMFFRCANLTSVGDLSGWDTGSVTDTSSMFDGCTNLTSLDLSSFDTANVTDTSCMFAGCTNLTFLDLSGWNTGSVTDMGNMFNSAAALTSLDLSSFDTRSVTNMGYMLSYMDKLQEVKLGAGFKFVGTNGYLPTPSSSYIAGADGKWYNSAGTAYAPADMPSNVADTYYASKRLVPAAASATALGLDAVDEEDTSSASIDADDGLQDSVTEAGSPICPDSPLLGTLTVEADPEDKGTLVAVASGLPDDAVPVFQWYRSGSPVQGASSDSYALTEPDVGSSIECRLSDSLGRYIGTITSNAVLVAKEPDGSISASIA